MPNLINSDADLLYICHIFTDRMKHSVIIIFLLMLAGCAVRVSDPLPTSCGYARYFDIIAVDSVTAVVSISPYDSKRDTLFVDAPMDNIICMSSTHVASLSEIGKDSLISAVSGLKYLTNTNLLERETSKDHPVYDIGYDASLDYERIIQLDPDILVTYTVSSAEPPYIAKLRSLGVSVLVIHDHLENHPLARAEYIRLFGAITGCMEHADSIFRATADRYNSLKSDTDKSHKKVLLNIPYSDAWYIPGEESYMSQLVRDAGGKILGSLPGTSVSGVISMEEAWALSQEADIWLNPWHCSTRDELAGLHQLFPSFGPLSKGLPIYNNTLRTTPEGGNDFYESGAVRPDLILEDLISILGESADIQELNYFKPVY